jgi:hypothetical protein
MTSQYSCQKPLRRARVLAARSGGNPVVNGIDFLEVATGDQKTLNVSFLFNLPGTAGSVPPSPAPALTAANIAIDGGVRITGIVATAVAIGAANNVLKVTANAAGDFSTYTLRLITGANNPAPPPGFDPELAAVDFSFKVECPSDFDCQKAHVCPPPAFPAADINYLAKDYASFRQLIFDRMARIMPDWRERNPADLGVALVELLAYAGDELSYQQDAVATEAYLGTARRRISVRRHARLLDYAMHEGCNARTWIFLQADPGAGVPVPKGTRLLTKVNAARGLLPPDRLQDALNQGATVFETMADITAHAELNALDFYTWSDEQCCLPRGATQATLADNGAGPLLSPGDVLLFEEVLGPQTGLAADADPTHRHVVRLTSVVAGQHDPLDGSAVIAIAWDGADALPFPLCISTLISDQGGTKAVTNVSIARGNLVLADHGSSQPPEALPDVTTGGQPYRPQLRQRELTFAAAYDDQKSRGQGAQQNRPAPVAGLLIQDPHQAVPAIFLTQDGSRWTPQPDLLGSNRVALDFVVEMEDDGTAALRFGDGILGAKPASGLTAFYRTGNGRLGNVGAGSIAHIVPTPTTPLSGITDVRNPLPAQGGVDPQPLDQVRAFAPSAFRTQERAVTAADYAAVAERHPEVLRAQANLRWTGSWYTMFVTVDRKGGQPVDAPFRDEMRGFLDQFRLAGYDLEIEEPIYVPLDIAFTICVAGGYFRSAVKSALFETFGSGELPDGRRGFFHPDNFTFGQLVFLSRVVAAAMQVPGVQWVDTNDIPPAPNRFRRWGQPAHGETAAGRIAMAALEIARLDNDPNRPENGKIDFFMEGGL